MCVCACVWCVATSFEWVLYFFPLFLLFLFAVCVDGFVVCVVDFDMMVYTQELTIFIDCSFPTPSPCPLLLPLSLSLITIRIGSLLFFFCVCVLHVGDQNTSTSFPFFFERIKITVVPLRSSFPHATRCVT